MWAPSVTSARPNGPGSVMATGSASGTRVWAASTCKCPRVRDGSFYPALLEPRRRAERALVAVVQEAYVQGVSTRRVDDLVQALGLRGISKSQVSRLCEELDEQIEASERGGWTDRTRMSGWTPPS